MWVVYAKGTDGDVNNFVARMWLVGDGEGQPTNDVMRAVELSHIRAVLEIAGFTPLQRSQRDDFNIIEAWI